MRALTRATAAGLVAAALGWDALAVCDLELARQVFARRLGGIRGVTVPATLRIASDADASEAILAGRPVNQVRQATASARDGAGARIFYEDQANALIERAERRVLETVRTRHPSLGAWIDWAAEAARRGGTASFDNFVDEISVIDRALARLDAIEGRAGFARRHAETIRSRFLTSLAGHPPPERIALSTNGLVAELNRLADAETEARRLADLLREMVATARPSQAPALPSNYHTQGEAQARWGQNFGAQMPESERVGGIVFRNDPIAPPPPGETGRASAFVGQRAVPSAPGRLWYEADVGPRLAADGGRHPFRLLYSSDGLVYYSFDHYSSPAVFVGRWRSPR